MPQLKLKTFDPCTIKDDRISLMVAPRGSGKSTMIQDIMYWKRHIPCGIVMSPTEEGNQFYKNMVPDSFIYNDFYPDALDRFMARQKDKVMRYRAGEDSFAHVPNAFLVLEDCMADKKVWKTKCVRDIFLNGRHRKVFVLITVQYLMDLSVELRSNVDYVFVLMDDSIKNKERIYNSFFSMFPSFDMFCQVMDQCTHDYGCLVLDRTIKSSRLEDKVFYYKAQQRPPYRVGCYQFWEYDRLRNKATATPEEEQEEVLEDDALKAVQTARSSNKPRITVVKEDAPPPEAPVYGYGNTAYGYGDAAYDVAAYGEAYGNAGFSPFQDPYQAYGYGDSQGFQQGWQTGY